MWQSYKLFSIQQEKAMQFQKKNVYLQTSKQTTTVFSAMKHLAKRFLESRYYKERVCH